MMDYSSVTTLDLGARRDWLFGKLVRLRCEQDVVHLQASEIEDELRRRRVGTTDDRLDWQEVGLR